MKIKLRTKERTIKMRGESASLSPKQRHRKAMALRAVREKAAQAAPSKQPERSSVEASAVDQVQQVGEFTARKAAYIAHEKRKLRKQARRSKTYQTDHTDNIASNDVAQRENLLPFPVMRLQSQRWLILKPVVQRVLRPTPKRSKNFAGMQLHRKRIKALLKLSPKPDLLE